MKLATTNTSPLGEPGFEYMQGPLGDTIYGSKEQLQRIGIAVNAAFPGESGGPKRKLKTTDHRGFDIAIRKGSSESEYVASIRFPNREKCPSGVSSEFAPGVMVNQFRIGDEYEGSAMALVNAGLARFDQMPGQPGMRKTTVTISMESGAKRIILRKSKDKFCVLLYDVDEEEYQRRHREVERLERQWKERMQRLPRPAPLIDLGGDAIPSAKTKPAPKYHAEGNVLHLLPRTEGRTAP